MLKTQEIYKYDYHRLVLEISVFNRNDYVIVNILFLRSTSDKNQNASS